MDEKKISLPVLPWVLVLSEPAFEKNCHNCYFYPSNPLPAILQELSCDTLATVDMPHNHFELKPEFPLTVSAISASGAQHYGYQIEFECPACEKKIGHFCDSSSETLSEAQAKVICPNDEVWCGCGWHGWTGPLKLVRIYRNAWLSAGGEDVG